MKHEKYVEKNCNIITEKLRTENDIETDTCHRTDPY